MSTFTKVAPETLGDNAFQLVGDDWMLITAGNRRRFNMMTASWGTLGVLWNRPVAICFVRPTRYTYEFIEAADTYSLSFYDERHRDALNFCGTHSGRDVDKVARTGLTPAGDPEGPVYFQEARLVLLCRKLYFDDLRPERFLDPAIEKLYREHDYHRFYIGEVTAALQRGDAL